MLSGGRGDELATPASMPGEAYGFWVDRGATIIQTDEPKAAIEWLEANGFRVPYPPDEQKPVPTGRPWRSSEFPRASNSSKLLGPCDAFMS